MLLTRVKSCYYFYYLYDKIIKEWACSMGRVFISYSHKNFEIVSKVNDSLRKNHILTWFDNDDIHDSDYWDTHIKTAIFASNVFLMFYSKEYLASPYCKKEFEIAKSKGNNMKIVVVGLDEASNSYSIDQQIGAIQRIKYSYQTDSDEKLITQILKSETIKSCSFVSDDIVDEKETTDFFHGISTFTNPKHYELLITYIKFLSYIENKERNGLYLSKDASYSSLVFARTNDENHSLVLRCIGEKDFTSKKDNLVRDNFLKNVLYAFFYYGSVQKFDELPSSLSFDEVFKEGNELTIKVYSLINDKINELFNKEYDSLNEVMFEFNKVYSASLYYESYLASLQGQKFLKHYDINPLVITISRMIYLSSHKINKLLPHDCLPSLFEEDDLKVEDNVFSSSLSDVVDEDSNQDIFLYGNVGCGERELMLNHFIENGRSLYIDLNLAKKNAETCLIRNYLSNINGYSLDYSTLYNYSSFEKTVTLVLDNFDYLPEDIRKDIILEISSLQNAFKIIIFSSKRNVEGKISLDHKDSIFKGYKYFEILPLSKDKIISYLSYCSVDKSIIDELESLDGNDSFFCFFNNFTKLNVLIDSIKNSSDFSIKNFKNKNAPEIEIYQMIFESEKDFSISKRISKFFDNTIVPIDDVIVDLVLDEVTELKKISYHNDLEKINELRFKDFDCSFNILSKTDGYYRFLNEDIKSYFVASYIMSRLKENDEYSFVENLLIVFENDYNVLKYLYEFDILSLINLDKLFSTPKEEYLSLKYITFKLSQYGKKTRSYYASVSTIEEIPDNFFFGAENISVVNIPNSTKVIGRAAFANMTRLKKLILTSYQEELIIRPWAILNCQSLESIKLGTNYKQYNHPLISKCDNIQKFIIDENNEVFSTIFDGMMLTTKDKKGIYACLNSATGEIRIPEGTLYLYDNCLAYLNNVTNVIIPKSVIEIETNFTDFCDKLERIDVEEGNPIYSSDKDGFVYTYDERGKVLFRAPSGYKKDIIIPRDVTVIGSDSISCCGKTNRIVVPSNIKYVENYAFADTVSLKTLEFEDISSVKEFGNYIFLSTNKYLSILINDDEDDDEEEICTVDEFNKTYNRDVIKEFSIESVDAPIYMRDFEKEGFEILADANNTKSYKKVVLLRAINLFDNLFPYKEENFNILLIGMTEYNSINSKTPLEMKRYVEELINQKHVSMIVFTRDLPFIPQLEEYKDNISMVRTSKGSTGTTKKVIEIIKNRGVC